MFVELKTTSGRVQDSQRAWIERLTAQGYRAVVCYGFEAAKAEIEKYLASTGISTEGSTRQAP